MNKDQLIRFLKEYPLAIGMGVVTLIILLIATSRDSEIQNLETSLEDAARRLQTTEITIRNAADIESHIAAINSLNEQITPRLFNPAAPNARIEQYYFQLQLGTNRDITIAEPGPSTLLTPNRAGPIATTKLPQLQFTLVFSGRFEECLAVMESMQHHERFIVIDSLTLAPEGSPRQRLVKATIRFRALAAAA